MIKTGFFNSINSDRGYNADDISDYFKGLITDGVFKNYLEDLSLSEDTHKIKKIFNLLYI